MTGLGRRAFAGTFCLLLGLAPAFANEPVPVSPQSESASVPAPGESATPAPPVFGDLTHLTFTAMEPLHANFVSPLPQSAASGAATAVEVSTGLGGGVELRAGGEIVPFERIGKRVVDGKAGETRYTYYGVPLQPGPNTLEATPLGAGGARGATVSLVVYGPGRPSRFEITLEGALRADGRTEGKLHVAAFDRWNHPALPGAIVRIAIVEGDAHLNAPAPAPREIPPSAPPSPAMAPAPSAFASSPPAAFDLRALDPAANASGGRDWDGARTTTDTYSVQQTIELPLGDDGRVAVPIVPGLLSGNLRVRVSAGGDVWGEGSFFVRPSVREPIIAGLLTAGAGQVPSIPGEEPGAPNGANSRTGRIALFASGEIARNTLGTFAYDTADVLQPSTVAGPFVDDPNARQYSTYGDSSIRRDDALSRDHLYLRLDNDRNSAMWGEFQAQTGGHDGLGGFNLLVAGAKLDLANDASKLTLFNARNDVAYARRIFEPTGISTLPQLLNPEIVLGSDTITLVTIDRNTGVVLSQTVMTRNVDYTLDYSTGFLRFINIPLPFDDHFNPQQILVQYEYAGSGAGAETTGARFETGIGAGRNTRLGLGYVNDANGIGNFTLFGQDLSGALPGGSWSIGHVSSSGVVAGTSTVLSPNASGDAFRAALSQTRGPNQIALGFDWTSDGYANPFGGLSTPGLLDYHASLRHKFERRDGELTFSFDHEQNTAPGYGSSQTNFALKAREALTKRFIVKAGVETYFGPVSTAVVPIPGATPPPFTPAASGSTTQAFLGFDWMLFPTVGLAVERTSNIGGYSNASQPGQTSAQLNVDFPKKGRLFVRELWADAPTQSFALATSGLTTAALATRSTAIGFERLVGKGTTLDSEYVLQQTGSGSDIYSAMGIKQRFDFNKRLKGDAFVQHANAIGPNLSGFNIYGIAATYTDGARVRGSTSYQLRTGDNPGATWSLGFAGALSPDFSLEATVNNSRAYNVGYDDARIGLAWRPSQNDRGVTLLEYERKDGTLAPLSTHAEILSLEQAYRATRRLELAGRYAFMLDGDTYYPAQTSLLAVRARQTIGARFDIGGETSYLDVNVPGAQQVGLALEAGYRIGDGMRLAGGYNFAGSPDPLLSAAPTRRGIYATVTTVVDRLLGWGKGTSWGAGGSAK